MDEASVVGAAGGGHSLEQLVERLKKRYDPEIDTKILNVYLSGSRVYGTANAESDWDYIIVTNQHTTNCFVEDGERWTPDLPFPPSNNLDVYEDSEMNFDVSFITIEHFTILLREHRLCVLECLFLPRQFVLLERTPFSVSLDLDILRKTVSWEASLKFDHAKRRLTEGKAYKAQKLIWLSIRYLIFAIQLTDEGRIHDFQAANELWAKMCQEEIKDWAFVEENFRPIFKAYDSQFKLMRNFNDFYSKDDLQSSTWLALHMHPSTNATKAKVSDDSMKPHALAVVNYLRMHGLKKLQSEYTIVSCRHRKYPNLVQLSSTAFTPLADNVGGSAKTLIVDENARWEVVAYAYPQAMHATDDSHTALKWDEIKVYEKLDGALAMLFHYKDEWHVATARVPDADEAVCWKSLSGEVPPKQTFSKKFWDTWTALGYRQPKDLTKCYMFELVADDFRRIVRYEAPRIVLHGVRDVNTLLEEEPGAHASENGWECVREFPHLTTHEEIVAATKALNPWQQAGFVVRDASGNRIKCLSPQYMAFFFAMGWQNKGFGPLNLGGENFDFDCLVEVHRFKAEHVFLHFFPKWAELMAQAAGAYAELVARFDAYYAQVRDVTEQRELAQRVKALALPDKTWPALIFEMKKEDVRTSRTFFAFIPRSRFLKLWKIHRNLAHK